jgi:uncharacterized membrane protein
LDQEVIESLRQQDSLSKTPDAEHLAGLYFGQSMADRFATMAGSWGLILAFTGVLTFWILINTI